jgi:two-component system, LuxR family, response regulator DctR
MTAEYVHIVDDDEAVREALAWLLSSVGLPARAYASGEDFLDAGGPAAAGVVLLDVRMGGMSGLEVFNNLRQAGSTVPVIFLTGHGDVPLAVGAIKSGAFDFLEKPFHDGELLRIIERALAADRQTRKSAKAAMSRGRRLQSLSAREAQVMELLLAGKANKMIAAELGIATRTVEVHRARIFEKMAVKSAVELSVLLSSRKTLE